MEKIEYPIGGIVTPQMLSYSSISKFKQCPRQWSLKRSPYSQYAMFPQKLYEATLVGILAHEMFSILIRKLLRLGAPSIKSELGMSVWKHPQLSEQIVNLRDSWWQNNSQKYVLCCDIDSSSIVSKVQRSVSKQLRVDYVSSDSSQKHTYQHNSTVQGTFSLMDNLRKYGSLSEVFIQHPHLPLQGYIDLLSIENNLVTVTDIKTGKRSNHHFEQVQLYALMFWRETGILPTYMSVSYNGELSTKNINRADLETLESNLQKEIEHIKSLEGDALDQPPQVSDACGHCVVRHMCNDYWNQDDSIRISDYKVKITGQRQGDYYNVSLGSKQGLLRHHPRLNQLEQQSIDTLFLLRPVVSNIEETVVFEIHERTEIYYLEETKV